MALEANLTLGRFRLIAPLGAGGMGEVWRARDERLGRDVAIKVLPAEFAANPERLKRFAREARATAALSHPNILAVHDVGTHEGLPYLVEELLEGESLREEIGKGRLTVARSVDLGIQIARGLAAAHERGIVHRDLKPGNVFITHDGTVKILDFGLAKLVEPDEPASAIRDASTREAQTAAAARLGTVGYMAPEQVRGLTVDQRTDIFAFGCVLFEMVTSRRAFKGDTEADTISAILTSDPPLLSLAVKRVSPGLERIVRRCLEKRPEDRFSSAHDLSLALEAASELQTAAARQLPVLEWRHSWSRLLALVAAALALVGVGAIAVRFVDRNARGRVDRSIQPVVRSSLDVAPAEDVNAGGWSPAWLPTAGGSRTALAWTPDGRAFVFVGRRGSVQQLFVRSLDAEEGRALAGTEGAQMPAVSADGRWVAYWADGAIRKVAVTGGPVSVLVASIEDPPAGMAWGGEGPLLVARFDHRRSSTIWKAESGQATQMTALGTGEYLHVLPQWLPGEVSFLYTARERMFSWGGEKVVAHNVTTGERTLVLDDAVDARYVAGHLVFLRMGTLFAVRFDPTRLRILGEPAALVGDVAQALVSGASADITGAGQFAVAPTGSLVYIEAPLERYREARLVAIDRGGRVDPLANPVRGLGFAGTRAAPDGTRVVVHVQSVTELGPWIYDLDRGVFAKLPGTREAFWATWTPDGERLVFDEIESGTRRLAWQSADGSSRPESFGEYMTPACWTPDGRELIGVRDEDIRSFVVADPAGGLHPVVQTPAAERAPALSRDGRWLAYESDASGRFEVYVQPYPGPGPRVQVSTDGGVSPAWHPSGRELFFLGLTGKSKVRQMMAVELTPAESLRVSRPRTLFTYNDSELDFACFPLRCYDVAPDGERFYVTQPLPSPPTPPVTQIHLVLNWLDEVKARLAGTATD